MSQQSETRLADEVSAFAATLPYRLDPFQQEACTALSEGRNVLVCAPTGSGKTAVADFAMYRALQTLNDKVFYTTPIKALSNQKFHDLAALHGDDAVGLLTGDINVNPNARIVVMTTEVLRNMIYERSARLEHLSAVVLDEVHYLADRFRGAVWEEVIIQLPSSVALVALSATISNADEFGAWLEDVHGATDVIIERHRPVPLEQHVYGNGELIDMFASGGKQLNPAIQRLTRRPRRNRHDRRDRHTSRRVSRPEVVRMLRDAELLPAIVFIFSRYGCEQAVEQCTRVDLHLTTKAERRRIRHVVETKCAQIPDADRRILGFDGWFDALQCGVAAHHAGLLPVFKEVVETLVLERLVKVVFATETLALGVNMPVRTVVLETLDKFNGQHRVDITPGEYTQLTGRAGRRGIDTIGHAVVLWRPDTELDTLRHIAVGSAFPLRSSFRPTYNMAVNLIESLGTAATQDLLEQSFAQFQADRSVIDLVKRRDNLEHSTRGYTQQVVCDRGDFAEYAALRHRQRSLERAQAAAHHAGDTAERERLLAEITSVREQLTSHPCHDCPDRERHARWEHRQWKLQRDIRSLDHQIEQRTTSIAHQFQQVRQILAALGYLSHDEHDVNVTATGALLKRLYGERDLLTAECLRLGIWDHLDAPTLAAIVAALVYEPRREELEPIAPNAAFDTALHATTQRWAVIDDLERQHHLPGSEPPNAGLSLAVYRWVSGSDLDIVLHHVNVQPGDFVRLVRQTGDILGQLTITAVEPLRATAFTALDALERGVMGDDLHE